MTLSQWSKADMFRFPMAAAIAAWALGLQISPLAQGPPASNGPQAPPTGLIVGQVVEFGGGAPVSEAIVTLVSALQTTPGQSTSPRVKADGEGRFFFTALAAGEYSLTVAKEGYVNGAYGARRPYGLQQRVRLAEGERRADVTVELTKYAVISGTVVDEAGEPVVGIAVRAIDRVPGATVIFGNYINITPAATTDDRGVFRIAQLIPASYVVLVPSTLTSAPVSVLNSFGQDAATRQQLSSAIAEIAPLGSPRTLQVGDAALMTLNRAVIPPPPDSSNRLEIYRTTYYPSATTAGAAALVTLTSGEERAGVDIAIRPVPAFTVTGRLVLPDGTPPAPTAIRLLGEASADLTYDREFEVATGVSDAKGQFTLLGVPPGKYALKTYIRQFGTPDNPLLWSSETLTVATADVGDVVVRVRPGLSIEGRVELRGPNGAPAPISEYRRPTMTFLSADRSTFGIEALMTPAGTFAGYGGAGPYYPTVLGGAWYLRSCVVNGKDVADGSFAMDTNIKDIVVTLTNQTTPLSGAVIGVRGTNAGDATVAIFAVNPQKRSAVNPSWRTMQTARVSPNGSYAIANIPAGDYFVVAIDDREADGWEDPTVLEALSRVASRITMTEGEAKTLDLTVKSIK